MAFARFDFYCDEAGNTGTNYLDASQPVHVLAGWTVPRRRRKKVTHEVLATVTDAHIQGPELHAARLLRTERGLRIAWDVFAKMRRLGCIPLFVLFEKGFGIAANAVEAFLDPAFNSRIGNEWTNRPLKRATAVRLHEIPGEWRSLLAVAYRRQSGSELAAALDALIADCRAAAASDLADLLQGARPHLEAIAESLDTTDFAGRGANSINFLAFAGMLQLIHQIAGPVGVREVQIVHDETPQFEESFAHAVDIQRNAQPAVFRYADGEEFVTGLSSLAGFGTERSIESPLVQAADLLASSLRAICERVLAGDEVSGGLERIAGLTLPALVFTPPRLAIGIACDGFLAKLAALGLRALNSPLPS
jgi:hypothetical protein